MPLLSQNESKVNIGVIEAEINMCSKFMGIVVPRRVSKGYSALQRKSAFFTCKLS